MNAIVINLILFTKGPSLSIYTILDFSYYLLSISTLIDNYSIIYIINSKYFIKLSIFIKLLLGDIIEVRSSSLLIIRRSTRVIKNTLNRVLRLLSKDLNLLNIAIIKEFYINIISKAIILYLRV